MGGNVRKPYLELQSRPILSWTLASLARVTSLREIILVTRPEDREPARFAVERAELPRRVSLSFADGGKRRQDSVFNGLCAATPASKLVLIHDAARPFPAKETMRQALEAAHRCGGAILAKPVRDTIKKQRTRLSFKTPMIDGTVPREQLWQAQTPQVFQLALILRLFRRLMRAEPETLMTDDAAVCEHFGKKVALIESSATNIKVTRPEDVPIAEAYLKLGLVSFG